MQSVTAAGFSQAAARVSIPNRKRFSRTVNQAVAALGLSRVGQQGRTKHKASAVRQLMGTDLQRLRDEAESRCLSALANNDRDSADAWERIGLAIQECIDKTKHDLRIIEARTGPFGVRV
jgi:hypothetical protein